MGVKISAPDLDDALTGSSIYKYSNDQELALYLDLLN